MSITFSSVKISDDGKTIGMCATSGEVFVGTLTNETWSFYAIETSVSNWSCIDTKNGNNIALCSSDGLVYVSSNKGTDWQKQDLPSKPWSSIASNYEGNILVICSSDGLVYIKKSNKWTQKLNMNTTIWNSVSMTNNGSIIVLGRGNDKSIYVSFNTGDSWNQNNWQYVDKNGDRNFPIVNGTNNIFLLTSTNNNPAYLTPITNNTTSPSWQIQEELTGDYTNALSISSDGLWLATLGYAKRHVYIWKLDNDYLYNSYAFTNIILNGIPINTAISNNLNIIFVTDTGYVYTSFSTNIVPMTPSEPIYIGNAVYPTYQPTISTINAIEGSAIIFLIDSNGNTIKEFTAIPGELNIEESASGEYAKIIIPVIFNNLNGFIYTKYIFENIQNVLSEFFSNVALNKRIIKRINKLNEEFLSGKITIEKFNELVKIGELEFSDEYGPDYVNNYVSLQIAIQQFKYLLNRQ